jgi:hypothetical protein
VERGFADDRKCIYQQQQWQKNQKQGIIADEEDKGHHWHV